ncbi:hypothetical protein [Neolewinella persica]|uniref:hypothetical protein n=1 Tax=Neolewinella persica TaxID=70998 RepID=UPI00036274DA|nr:hypothetical protein [Neolewinella persica]
MNKDITTPEVQDIIVAVVPRDNGTEEELWDTYIVNLRTEPMESVLITSQGYGEINGSDKTTTVLRHFHQIIMPNSFLKVEPIQRELFDLKNEYWISFNEGEVMLDKRYVFQAGEISPQALKVVPVLDRPGVMLR